MVKIEALKDLAATLRRDVLKMTTKAGSGHPTTCLSCGEIMSVLFFYEMAYDVRSPHGPDNDEFILSKGHAAPVLYAVLARTGCTTADIMTLRMFGSPFEGHPLPSGLKWVKVATGALGQGLSVGVGMALAAKMQKRKYRTYVLLGDGETAEGSVYEALQLAVHYNLDNLCAIIDVNRLGQSGETMLGHDIEAYRLRFASFGANVIPVEGHDIPQLIGGFSQARDTKKKPSVILAKTLKGKGVSFLENKEGWHGKALSEEELDAALQGLPNPRMPRITVRKPTKTTFVMKQSGTPIRTRYKKGEMIATREGYGNALVKLSRKNNLLVATDAEVKNSTFADRLFEQNPQRFVEAYIAEQNMVGVALGMSVKGFNVFASSFAAFLSRAHDQLRMAALSEANLTLVGSHGGVSIGEDGPSQMGLEDIALFRSLPGSIVLYPSDAVASEKLVELASNTKGLKYIRTSRPKTPVIYDNDEHFPLGDFKILAESSKDQAVVIGAGITVHEALKAYEELNKRGISVAVVDLYCIKPFNAVRLQELVNQKGHKVVVVEDHYPEGGIGEMVGSALDDSTTKISCLAVRKIPHSGKSDILLKDQCIDKDSIVELVIKLVRSTSQHHLEIL